MVAIIRDRGKPIINIDVDTTNVTRAWFGEMVINGVATMAPLVAATIGGTTGSNQVAVMFSIDCWCLVILVYGVNEVIIYEGRSTHVK